MPSDFTNLNFMSHSQRASKNLRLWALGTALCALVGCATTNDNRSPAPLSNVKLMQQADEAEAAGNYVIAAQSYLQLSEQSQEKQRSQHRLSAARLLQRGHLSSQAEGIIKQVNPVQLSLFDHIQLKLLLARIALSRQQADRALQVLRISNQRVPSKLQADWHKLRAEAYLQAGNYLEAAREYVLLEPQLFDPEAIKKNHEQIWAALQPINASALMTLRTDPAPDILSGWLELAYLYKNSIEQSERLRGDLIQWLGPYANHPASGEFLDSLLLRQYKELDLPDNIALLLPLTGKFAAPAKAVRDGFLAAYFNRKDSRYNPEIRIYDTEGDLIAGLNIYHRAIAEGAEFIVGPLHKPLLEHLSEVTEFSVTTLALNYLNHQTLNSENLYQYGLLPEDEARQVAERAWLEGFNKALILTPEGEWGDRMLNTFSQHWQQLDGRVLESQRYDASRHDFAQPVVKLLNIDESRQRYQALKNLLDLPIKSEPRRREDVDFIYIAAFPGQARQIRPQLKFYYASDIPVFSTSHLYSGEPNPTLDRDMDGIQFCDMPWVFNEQTEQSLNWQTLSNIWGNSAKSYKRLYAMGIDAFNLIGRLDGLANNPQRQFSAQSGRLYLDENQRIHRQLQWAKFVAGEPHPIDTPEFSPANIP